MAERHVGGACQMSKREVRQLAEYQHRSGIAADLERTEKRFAALMPHLLLPPAAPGQKSAFFIFINMI